ncbi:MAG: SOS response-associated peptidase [Coriobacteriales bacterium]|jgi:putative SOS response-associated peptidase YedK|nr:SOS response-associated peptidase [Coriobacteriales bacterium]
MCGRYVIFTTEEAVELRRIVAEAQRRADEVQSGVLVKTGELFPADVAPVLVPSATNSSADALEARPMVWGYPGFDTRRHVIFNTRIEQAAQRPMWSESFVRRRCVVPTSGFYEWRHVGGAASRSAKSEKGGQSAKGAKEKLLFTWPDGATLYLAGIYRSFGAPAETDTPAVIQAVSALHDRFSIMTTAANASVRDVHDRMPVVLRPDELDEWLFGEPRAFSIRSNIELCRQV